jgi:nitrogen-specific signal transduction histidine kinase/CheY-like chemotaxis protein
VFIGYMRDITERKRAEAERGRLEAQLRQAQKMEAIGHLAGGIAHDFNNILTGVMGYVAMASERAGRHGDERLGRYLDRAHRSGQRAQDLIRQLLTFSRGQRGEPRPLDLAALVRDAVGLLGSTLPSSLELSLDLPEDLPPVNMDPVHVEQVLMNLCINARDAMEGTGHLRVAVAARHLSEAVCASCRQPVRGRFVELAVGDSGPGIAPAHLERIFEPFFTTKAVGKGSGMGLSTVHGIVHEHGAHLVVDTAPREGTVFRVLFPALDGPGARSGGAAEAGTGSAPVPGGLQGRVLVVDDDESVSELMQDLFESWGLEVVVARDGAAGLEAFSRDTRGFDLALLDQTMPRMTGLELAGHLLALRPRLPILMYTGYSEHISERRVKQAGVHALLRKPVDPALLYARVRDLLGAS